MYSLYVDAIVVLARYVCETIVHLLVTVLSNNRSTIRALKFTCKLTVSQCHNISGILLLSTSLTLLPSLYRSFSTVKSKVVSV